MSKILIGNKCNKMKEQRKFQNIFPRPESLGRYLAEELEDLQSTVKQARYHPNNNLNDKSVGSR